jgi:hypothetical protein
MRHRRSWLARQQHCRSPCQQQEVGVMARRPRDMARRRNSRSKLWPAAAAQEHGREDGSCSSGLHSKAPSETNGSLQACYQCGRPLWAPGTYHWPANHTQDEAHNSKFAHRQIVAGVESCDRKQLRIIGSQLHISYVYAHFKLNKMYMYSSPNKWIIESIKAYQERENAIANLN